MKLSNKHKYIILLIIIIFSISFIISCSNSVSPKIADETTTAPETTIASTTQTSGENILSIPVIEGLKYDTATNIYFAESTNPYGLAEGTKSGVFLKDAFELNGIVESSICLIPEILKILHEKNIYTNKEFQFPIPFDLVRANSIIMNVIPIELNYDDPEKKNFYMGKYTHLQIKVPSNTQLYAPIETRITDEWNGCIISNKNFEEYKDISLNTMRLTLNSPDKLKYQEPNEIVGAHVSINEINNCISSFSMNLDDIKKYDTPNPTGPPWYKIETEIGTPLLILNNDSENNNFPLDVKPSLEMFFKVYKVGFDEERQWYEIIKDLETAENIFLEVENIKLSVIPKDNFPSDEEIKYRNSKNNILISETKDIFNGLKITGLDNIWRYEKWIYVDKEDNSIVGYWDENNNSIIILSDVLKSKWQDLFIGLPLESVQELQESEGWPPAFPFNPIKYSNFTAKVDTMVSFNNDNETINTSFIVFNLPENTEIIAPVKGALTFGGGSFSEKGANTVHVGLNNILGRVKFSYLLKEPLEPIDMDELKPKSYDEGNLLLKIENVNTTIDFGIVRANYAGNLAMVMEEGSDEFESPLMSMDFNSFLKNKEGRIVYIDNQADKASKENQNNASQNNQADSSNKISPEITFPIKIRTLVLNYDPLIESQGGKLLHELCGWNNPRTLADGYVKDLNESSGGSVVYEITEWIDINDIIPYTDGFKYSGESFYEYFKRATAERWDYWSWNGWHAYEQNQASGLADYRWILNTNGLIKRLNDNEFDEIFIFAQPFSGMYESLMVGPNPIWCNSNPLIVPELNKNFVIMSFNYERGVDCMLENFGHRTESILSYVFNNSKIKGVNFWEKFSLYDKIAPGEAGCGNVHYAPNSSIDYDWGNKKYVLSTCNDWLNYPNLSGEKSKVNSSEWGNGDMRLHHIWWLNHIPKAAGFDENNMLNNWWGYLCKYYKGY